MNGYTKTALGGGTTVGIAMVGQLWPLAAAIAVVAVAVVVIRLTWRRNRTLSSR